MPIFNKPEGFSAKFLAKNPLNNGPFDQVEKLDLNKAAREGTTEAIQTGVAASGLENVGTRSQEEETTFRQHQESLKKKKKKKVTGGSSDLFAGSKGSKEKKQEAFNKEVNFLRDNYQFTKNIPKSIQKRADKVGLSLKQRGFEEER